MPSSIHLILSRRPERFAMGGESKDAVPAMQVSGRKT